MDYSTFRELISESAEPFFAAWELTEPPSSEWSSFVPFLRLLKTETIRNWANEFLPDNKKDGRWAAVVMPTLLERHLLPVANRRRPDIIGDFWREAVWFSPALARLWEQAELPETLDAKLTIAQQEDRFANVLREAADKVAQEIGPDHWAVKTLQPLARKRGLLGSAFAENAEAHVVFGFDQPAAEMRSGLIVPFRLLAPHGREIDIHPSHVFADDFLEALREHVRRRVPWYELRSLEHDCDFMGEKKLTGTSGTMAIWLAQFLAAGGLRDQRWTLPPWVLVTATLDRQGGGTGGAAGTVGLLRSKVEIALEEGVRVLVVASETGWSDDIASELGNLPGFTDDLLLLPVRAGDDGVDDLALKVKTFCWPLRKDAVGTDLHSTTSEDERYLIDERRDDKQLRAWEQDYIPPTFALRAIEAARQELPGRGYIHITAPAMWGKSFLILALRHGWKPVTESASLGKTLSYSILHGRPENPGDFLFDVFVQAKQQAGEPAFAQFRTPPHLEGSKEDTRRAVGEMLGVARQSQALRNRPLVLAIDALDEITTDDKDSNRYLILDFLPRAEELPDGCYILLTSRPELRPKVWKSLADHIGTEISETDITSVSEVPTDIKGLDPTPFYRPIAFEIDDDHRQLLREFLIASFGEPIHRHLDAILEHGQERFLYVRLLRDLLLLQMKEHGDAVLRDLQPGELPEADEVFPAYLKLLAHTVGSQAKGVAGSRREPNDADGVIDEHSDTSLFNMWHRPVLLLIAAAYEPITHDHLRCWLGPREWDNRANHHLNRALDELAPLLRTDRPPELPNTSRFNLAHRELFNWLHNNQHPSWQHAIRDEAHQCIVETAQRQPLPNSMADLSPIDFYHFIHAPSHCLDIGDHAAAWQSLLNSEAAKLLGNLITYAHDRWLWRQEIGVWDHRILQLGLLVTSGQQPSQTPSDFELQRHFLPGAYMERGNARQRQRDFVAAVMDYDCAIQLLYALLTEFGGAESTVTRQPSLVNSLACAHVNRGNARQGQQVFVAAVMDYDRAIQLSDALLTTFGGVDSAVTMQQRLFVNDQAKAFVNRGTARQGQQDFVGAVADYDRAIQLREKLLRAFGGAESAVTTQWRLVNDLAGACTNRGSARKSQKDFVGAVADYDRAIQLKDKLLVAFRGVEAAVTTQPSLVSDLAKAHLNRGNARQGVQDFVGAVTDYDRAIQLKDKLLAAFGGVEAAVTTQPSLINDLAGAYLNRGTARAGQREFIGAATDFGQAVELTAALLFALGGVESAMTAQPSFVKDLAVAYINRGHARFEHKDVVGAATDFDHAIVLLEALLCGMRQFDLVLFLNAIRGRIWLHLSSSDQDGFVVTAMRGVTAVVQLYQAIGPAIRLPSAKPDFEFLDRVFTSVCQSVTFDDSVRIAWDELRALFAQD